MAPIILSLTFCVTTMPPPGERLPLLIVDSHNINYDLARQYARAGGLVRRCYAGANWRKLRRTAVVGGASHLKIVEAVAMGKAIVSTTLGAEGIDAVPERDLLIEDHAAIGDRHSGSSRRKNPVTIHRPPCMQDKLL
jgi:hypothetical protein